MDIRVRKAQLSSQKYKERPEMTNDLKEKSYKLLKNIIIYKTKNQEIVSQMRLTKVIQAPSIMPLSTKPTNQALIQFRLIILLWA